MKALRTLSLALVLVVVAGLLAVPTFAQEPAAAASKTITEEQINDSFRVNNPRRARISEMSVDLQAGQAVIGATYSLRSGETVATTSTLVPVVSNGRIFWDVSSATADGETLSDELIAQINAIIDASWRNYIKNQITGYATGVTVTDADITFTYEFDRNTWVRPRDR